MDKNIIIECFVDTCLIETLVATVTGYNHQKGCNNVTKQMQERLSDEFALGIVDKDKRELEYLNMFTEVKRFNDTLFLHKHKTKSHYIIQIAPAVEKFILDSANICKITLDNYGLPSTLDSLKTESKNIDSKKDTRFKKLFCDLKQQGSENICKLAQWVEQLKANPYSPNLDLL